MIKVLIADDQALIRESLQIVLSAHQDIEVVGTVGDGLEVLDFLKSNRPHVILMDIRMPNLDGYSVPSRSRNCIQISRLSF